MLILLRDKNDSTESKISFSHFYDFLMKNHFNLIIQLNAILVLWKFIFPDIMKPSQGIMPSNHCFLFLCAVDLTYIFLSLIFRNVFGLLVDDGKRILIKRRKKVNFLSFLFLSRYESVLRVCDKYNNCWRARWLIRDEVTKLHKWFFNLNLFWLLGLKIFSI